MTLSSVDSIIVKETCNQNLQRYTDVSFKSNSKSNLERIPEQDTIEKKGMSTGGKIALATTAVAGVTVGILALIRRRRIKLNELLKQEKLNEQLKQEAKNFATRLERFKSKLKIDKNPQLQKGYIFEEFKENSSLSTLPKEITEKTEEIFKLAKTGEEVKIITNPTTMTRQVYSQNKKIAEVGYNRDGSLSFIQNFDDLGREIEYFEGDKIITKTYTDDTIIESTFIDKLIETYKLIKTKKDNSSTALRCEFGINGDICSLDIQARPNDTSKFIKSVGANFRSGKTSQVNIEKYKYVKSDKGSRKKIEDKKIIAFFTDGEPRKISKEYMGTEGEKIVENFVKS